MYSDSILPLPPLTSLERQIALNPEQILAEQRACNYFHQMENSDELEQYFQEEIFQTYFSQCNPVMAQPLNYEIMESDSSCALLGKRRSVDSLLS